MQQQQQQQQQTILRRSSRALRVGSCQVGGGAPVSVQTMTKTDTRDRTATITEIRRLATCGCDIIRVAVPDTEAAEALQDICRESPIPVIADIHFDHQLALLALRMGVHGLRINPGNLRSDAKVTEVAHAARDCGVPIRVGVNGGSLDPQIRRRFAGITAEGLAESALQEVQRLEKVGFTDIKIAVKAFSLAPMMHAVRLVAAACPYPLHLGVTEAGLPADGIIRSAMGIGTLLMEGLGDTLRVSLTGDSADELQAGIRILKCAGLRSSGPTIVSCPTCGRCQVPLQKMAEEVSRRLIAVSAPLRIAVMGCAVNGPGEAADADFGIAGGKGSGLLFRHGQVIGAFPAEALVDALINEIMTTLGKEN